MKKSFIILFILIFLGILAVGGFLYFSKKAAPPPTSSQPSIIMSLQLISPAFENNQPIPAKYTCDGANINPSLEINGVPPATQSLVLIVDDPDAPRGTWDHWLVYNINSQSVLIEENSVPVGSLQVTNSFGKKSYGGPCPPSGVHHYHFKLYALDVKLAAGLSSKKELEKAMANYLLAQTELIGLYQR